jgi:hypothetical protein
MMGPVKLTNEMSALSGTVSGSMTMTRLVTSITRNWWKKNQPAQ